MEVDIINFGGIITSVFVPDKEGKRNNIVLGFDNVEQYMQPQPFLGAIAGRFANRIANGRFRIGDQVYHLNKNDGKHHIHGGEQGFYNVYWNAETDDDALILSYLSRDGEQGYPGNLSVTVNFTLTDKNELKIDYRTETDKPTHVNLTSHAYFNLSGDFTKSILDHKITLIADHYTPVDDEMIPTGEIKSVQGTVFDFRTPKEIGARIEQLPGGYDHNYVLNGKESSMRKAAELFHPGTGRKMEVLTKEPGIQFYCGGNLDGSLNGYGGIKYKPYSGLCLETQHFPDTPNRPEFPSTLLVPEKVYKTSTIYRFSAG